jgi:arylsulfatase A-like enzyme
MPAATPPYWELYDLANDPKEMTNLYPSENSATMKAKLKAQLTQLKKDIGDTDDVYPTLMAVKAKHWNQ